MRPIDADALIEKCGGWYVDECTESGFIGTLENLLATEPTIQPQSTTGQLNDGAQSTAQSTDLIDRQAAIEALARMMPRSYTPDGSHPGDEEIFRAQEVFADCIEALKIQPSAQPEIKPIEYRDCANAMLGMWMDNVVTDGEYNRIMDKLNAHWGMKNE